MRLQPFVIFGVAMTLLAIPDVPAYPQTPAVESPTLQAGDHVRVTVLGDDKDLSGDFEVAPDSTVKHPLYSQVKVVGVPLPLLKDRFVEFLQRFQKTPQLQVEPLFKVGVSGEVKTPNIYFFAPETTVAEALTRANGATDRGDVDRVTLLRDGKTMSISLNRPAVNHDQLTVWSGDQISVPTRRSVLSGIGSITPILSVAVSLLSVTVLILNRR